SHARPPRDDPCVRAAVCYVVPLLPALVLLLRERRDRFVRVHAARALVFYLLLAVAQLTLYSAVVLLGGMVRPESPPTVAFGLVFYALLAALGFGAFLLWWALLHEAMSGRLERFPLLSGAAMCIERLFAMLWRLPL